MFANLITIFRKFPVRDLNNNKHLFCILIGIYINIKIFKNLIFRYKYRSQQRITVTLPRVGTRNQSIPLNPGNQVNNNQDNSEDINDQSISNSEFCQIFMKTDNIDSERLFINFQRFNQKYDDLFECILYERSLQILNIFVSLISNNTRTNIYSSTDTRRLMPRISRIDFICNYKHRQKVINKYNLESDKINKIPFNDKWMKNEYNRLGFGNFQSLRDACEESKPWFNYMLDFILSLNYQFQSINSKNIGFLGGLRVTTEKEFLLPCLIDCNRSFWCVCCHGTPNKEIGRDISKNGFIPSLNGLYGPGIYFSTQIKKNMQYVQHPGMEINSGHILICLVNLGVNPYFTPYHTNIVPNNSITSIIALGGYANVGSQIHTEIIVKDPEMVLPLYSFTIEEIYNEKTKGKLMPVLYSLKNNLSQIVEFPNYEGKVIL